MMEIGERVESRAAFEHYKEKGTVIAIKKPYTVPWGVLEIPAQAVVLFDDGSIKTMRAHWIRKL